jgi:hypothetical protein
MPWFDVRWYFPEDVDSPEDSNVAHLAEHGLTPDDFEQVLCNPIFREATSDSSGRPIRFGYACDGRLIAVVYEWIDDITVLPITAYVVEE